MKKGLVFTLAMGLFLTASAQREEPIFKSKEDSLQYHAVKQQLLNAIELSRDPQNKALQKHQPNLDSLFQVQNAILKKGLRGYRYKYYPFDGFYTLQDIETGAVNPMEVDKLCLSDWKGKSFPKKVLQCHNLKELQILHTSISKIPRRLNKLSRLGVIYLYDNMPAKRLRLGRNTHVHYLRIRGEHPEKLPRSYGKFKALDSLDMMRNLLEEFPGIQNNKKLKQLVLSENNLTLQKLPRRGNHSLENLFLRKNKISRIPTSIEKFTALKKLNLSYNEITEAGSGLANLHHLEQLSLYQNKLTAIPISVYSLHSLKEIDLYFNNIERVDSAICQLQNLKTLYLANNRLVSLHESIGGLSNLQELYLHHNRLSHLPESLGQLNNLRVLRINDNYFSSFPYSILSLSSLENLDLSHNKIQTLPVEISAYRHLKMLVLAANPWENKDQVLAITHQMREKGVRVHTDTFAEPMEDINR